MPARHFSPTQHKPVFGTLTLRKRVFGTLTLRKRVFGGFAATLSLLIVLAVVMQRGAGSVNQGAARVRDGSATSEVATGIALRVDDAEARALRYALSGNDVDRKAAQDSLAGLDKAIGENHDDRLAAPVARYPRRSTPRSPRWRRIARRWCNGRPPAPTCGRSPRRSARCWNAKPMPTRSAAACTSWRRSRQATRRDRGSSPRAIRPTPIPPARNCKTFRASVDRMRRWPRTTAASALARRSGRAAGALHRRAAGRDCERRAIAAGVAGARQRHRAGATGGRGIARRGGGGAARSGGRDGRDQPFDRPARPVHLGRRDRPRPGAGRTDRPRHRPPGAPN